jgi:hypothetical protein
MFATPFSQNRDSRCESHFTAWLEERQRICDSFKNHHILPLSTYWKHYRSYLVLALVRLSRGTKPTACVCRYIDRDLLEGSGSHDYGGWQVQSLQDGPVSWRPRRAYVPGQVQRQQAAVELGRADGADEVRCSLLEDPLVLEKAIFLFHLYLQLIGWRLAHFRNQSDLTKVH